MGLLTNEANQASRHGTAALRPPFHPDAGLDLAQVLEESTGTFGGPYCGSLAETGRTANYALHYHRFLPSVTITKARAYLWMR